jgi:hypothetical protein
MPYTSKSIGKGRRQVRSPHGIKARDTTPAKAKRQIRLLNAIEHNPDFKPRGAADRLAKKISG